MVIWLHLQTLVSTVCSDISWSHALAPFHSAKGENRYLLAADSREQAERTGRKLEDRDTGGLVASRTNAPAVNNPPLFFFASNLPTRCLSVTVMSSSYPSKWFVHCNWVTNVAIEPLHSSKLLMCACGPCGCTVCLQELGWSWEGLRGGTRKREWG